MKIKMLLMPCMLIAWSAYAMDQKDTEKFDLTQPPQPVTKSQLTNRLPQQEDECSNCMYAFCWITAILLGQEPTKQE